MSTATSTQHVLGHSDPPTVHVYRYSSAEPIAVINLDGHRLAIHATTPAQLRVLAEVFTDGARQLSDALDEHAARVLNGDIAVPA